MDPSLLAWFGLGIILAFTALFWIAGHVRAGVFLSDGPTFEDPWCASTGGSAARGHADTSDRPRQPLTSETLELHRARVRKYLESMGVPEREVDDLTQETIIGAWKNRASYDPERARLSSWLYAIAHHQASTARDRAYTRRTALFDPSHGLWRSQVVEDNPEEETARGEARRHAASLLSRLAPALAGVLVDRDRLGMLPAEITLETGLPVARIRDRIEAARAELGAAVKREEAREHHHEATQEQRRGAG